MHFSPGFQQNASVLFNDFPSFCHIPSARAPTSKHNYGIQRNHNLRSTLQNMDMGRCMVVKRF